jgi:hypothetical protein
MKICPYCHQDCVWFVRLRSVPEIRFKMCFECDSVWMQEQPVSDGAGSRFDTFMIQLGRPVDWKDVDRIGAVLEMDLP